MRFVPAEMRGRVFDLLRTLMQATMPIGVLLATPLLAAGGIAAPALAVGALLVLPAVAALVAGMLEVDRPP
jgi:hypothetical protein